MKAFSVLRAGLLTSVQDLGRRGQAAAGVPVGGAADPFSARLANRLVRNRDGAALLEMTMSGGQFEAVAELVIGAAGAPMPFTINGDARQLFQSHRLRAGDVIDFGAAPAGLRTYLAISGGIDVPEILGSRSTLLSAGFGGIEGRRLRGGDAISIFPGPMPALRITPELPDEFSTGKILTIRVLPGPQEDLFPRESVEAFLDAEFRVSSQSNRGGVRLEGATIPMGTTLEMAPEGVEIGSVQVPPSGEPIVLMPEGPVTGGYRKIAVAVSVDRRRLGQLRPGQAVRFARASLAEALSALSQEEDKLNRITDAQ